MAASRQSYADADVAAAMRTTYPEGLYQSRTSTTVNVAEDVEPESESDEQQVMSTEEQIQEVCGDEPTPIEEEDAIDVLCCRGSRQHQQGKVVPRPWDSR